MRRRWPASPPSRVSSRRSTRTGSSRRGGRSPPASTSANDFFIRTSDDGHKRFVQEFLLRIRENGRDDIYQDVYAGLYCVGCEAFKNEDELVDGKCPEHDIEPEWIEEKNWFFRLSAYQEQLLALYDERPELRAAGVSRQRSAGLHRRRAPGLLDQSSRSAVGHPDPVGPRSRRVRLGGRAHQLPQRAVVCAARARISCRASGPSSATCWRRTSCASTASTGPRCCSPPGTRCRVSCSCTATCSSTTGRSRSRSATSSTRST